MHTPGTAAATQRFEAPELHFSDLSAEVLAGVVAAATDLALVVDAQGVRDGCTVQASSCSPRAFCDGLVPALGNATRADDSVAMPELIT